MLSTTGWRGFATALQLGLDLGKTEDTHTHTKEPGLKYIYYIYRESII